MCGSILNKLQFRLVILKRKKFESKANCIYSNLFANRDRLLFMYIFNVCLFQSNVQYSRDNPRVKNAMCIYINKARF